MPAELMKPRRAPRRAAGGEGSRSAQGKEKASLGLQVSAVKQLQPYEDI